MAYEERGYGEDQLPPIEHEVCRLRTPTEEAAVHKAMLWRRSCAGCQERSVDPMDGVYCAPCLEVPDQALYDGPHYAVVPAAAGIPPYCGGCGWVETNHPGYILADHLLEMSTDLQR